MKRYDSFKLYANTDVSSNARYEWKKGYLCAVANLIEMYGDSTMVSELFGCCPMSEYRMRKIGVDERDILLLRPVIKEFAIKRKSLK